MRCAEQAVSVEVRVDLDSAVVVYRPAAGEERASPVKQVSLSDLFHAAPWRNLRVILRQLRFRRPIGPASLAPIYARRLDHGEGGVDVPTGMCRYRHEQPRWSR
jgi:hypothetical protein